MKQSMQFILRTIVAGVLFLGPVLVLIVVIGHAIKAIGRVLAPVASSLPIKPMFGLAAPEIAAAILLVLVGFLAGLIAQTAIARRVRKTVEQLILSKVPGYTLFKAVAEGTLGETAGTLKVALANIDDAWLMAFIVEQHADGLLTVFVPSAPTPTAGSIYFLKEEQVRRIDVPVSAAIKCIMQLGVGSQALLKQAAVPATPKAVG